MELLRIAFANVLKERLRTIPVCLGVTLGVTALHLSIGFLFSTMEALKFDVIYGGMGHIQVAHTEQFKGYTETPLRFGLTENQQKQIDEFIATADYVASDTKQATLQGLISNGTQSFTFSGTGIEHDKPNPLYNAANPITLGKNLSVTRDLEFRVVLGKLLGEQMESLPGSFVTLLSTTEDGGINAIDLDVVGWMSTGVPQTDALNLNLPIGNVLELLQTEKVSKIIVYLKDDAQMEKALAEFAQALPEGIVAKPWYDLAVLYHQIEAQYRSQFTIFGLIICVSIFLSVFSASVTSVLERTFQIGVMRSLGISKSNIRRIFLIEAATLGVLGATLGLGLSFVAVNVLSTSDIMLPPPPGRNQEIPLRIFWDGTTGLWISLAVVMVCVSASYFATRRIFSMNVIDAIRKG